MEIPKHGNGLPKISKDDFDRYVSHVLSLARWVPNSEKLLACRAALQGPPSKPGLSWELRTPVTPEDQDS